MALPTTFHGFCTPDYFVECYDVRLVCDYLSDTGEPVLDLESSPFAAGDLDENTTLLRLLTQATQKLKMAVRQSNRYTLAMLVAMYEDVDTADHVGRRDEIMRLVADIAYGLLVARRGLALEEVFKLAPMYKEALDTLEALKTGARIFDDLEDKVATAGHHVASVPMDSTVCSWSRAMSPLLGGGGYDPVTGQSGCGCG